MRIALVAGARPIFMEVAPSRGTTARRSRSILPGPAPTPR